MGYNANWKICDPSNRASVKELAEFAAYLGTVRNVIHSAGLSTAMAKPEQLIRVNAFSTVYVNREFANVMSEGSVIVDVSSNSAWLTIFRAGVP